MRQSVIITLFFAAEMVATSANLRGNVSSGSSHSAEDRNRNRELMRKKWKKKRMRRLRRKRRKMRQRARQQALVRTADPWEMEDKDDGNDWDVEEEEIIDIFDWDDEDDPEEAAAAFEEEVAEFEAAVSALSDVAMSDASETTEFGSSAAIASVSTWFLLVDPTR
eukprot:scaffold6063_cov191-Skeletonema_marinoi.AAC.12